MVLRYRERFHLSYEEVMRMDPQVFYHDIHLLSLQEEVAKWSESAQNMLQSKK